MKNKKFLTPSFWGEKLLLFVLALLAILFFSNDFGLIDVQKTAIITEVGIDVTEDKKYEVTAKIAVPEASKNGSESKAVALSGAGETVAKAFQDINARTGWYPKLIFCDVILLGEGTVKADVFDVLGYFLRNQYMSDNVLLATCQGSAKDLLNTQIPAQNLSGFSLNKILSTEARAAGNVSTVNLKDFAVGYYSNHKSGFMPYVTLLSPQDGEGGGNDANGGNGGGGGNAQSGKQSGSSGSSSGSSSGGGGQGGKGGKSGQGGNEENSEKVFDASQTAVFYEGKQVALLNTDESFAINLTLSSIRLASMQVDEGDFEYSLALTGVKSKVLFKMEGTTPVLKVNLQANARTNDTNQSASLNEVALPNAVPDEVLRLGERQLKERLSAVFEKCRAVNCDVFELLDKLEKFENKYFDAYKDVLLSRIIPSFEVTLKDTA